IVTKEGFEADDILGTIAKSCSARGDECYIATGDRDSLQLIDDNVHVALATTQMGKGSTQIMDREAVFEKYGLYPEKLIDLKALMGDTSDNIPGVKGVGEKTAVTLLQNFGSLDGVYENIDDAKIKKGVREKLVNDKNMAYLSKILGTIKCDVEMDTAPESYAKKEVNSEKVSRTLKHLEMFSLADKLVPQQSVENLNLFDVVESALDTVEIKEFDNSLSKAIIYQNGGRFIIMWDKDIYSADAESELLKAFLADENKEKIAYDSKALYTFCLEKGIDIKNVSFCMKLAAYLANPLAPSYDFERITASADAVAEFDCEDSFAPFAQQVYEYFCNFVEKENQRELLYDIEMPLAKVLAEMEHEGFGMDKKALEDFGAMLKEQLAKDLQDVYDMVGYEFNLNSPKQLGKALFEDLELPAGKKTKSGYSTNAEVLEGLRKYHPVIDKILNYRTYQKLNSTYVEGMKDKIRENGRIHTTFQQMVTATGRISSTDPNLQNIPIRSELGGEVRKMFVPQNEDMCFVDADYSQIELRVLAHITRDEEMCRAFSEGRDIHTQTASQVFGVPVSEVTPEMRRVSKAVNFGIVYGISEFSLAEDIGVSRFEAKRYMESYLSHFCGVRDYMKEIVERARRDGFVTTMFGRRRYIPEITSKNFNIRSFGERVALNAPIQGSAADIIKIAMIKVRNRLAASGLAAKLIMQVHDELIVECKKSDAEKVAKLLREEMESACELSVPLCADAGIGDTWYDAKK
ncbi:MAG: DNA polymerase I, partial [Oscillospiraceae bacterium]|nr:DNA polymerase I [Oscillospiraceae bacterium]